MDLIEDIIKDFFQINKEDTQRIIKESLDKIEKSIDIYQFSKYLNTQLTYQDKIDLITCIFEIAYIDSELHYLENHYIKSIANLLNIEKKDLIVIKNQLKSLKKLQ